MKSFVFLTVALLFAIQVSAEVGIEAEGTENLETDEKKIVASVSEVLATFVKTKGNMTIMRPLVMEKRDQVEQKLEVEGDDYLQTLAAILSRIHFSDDLVTLIVNTIQNNMEEE